MKLTKDFLKDKVINVDYSRIKPYINNKLVKQGLNILKNDYNISPKVKLSLDSFKQTFLKLISNFKKDYRKDFDDKYHQKGWNKFFNILYKAFNKLWERALNIVCSITASFVVFGLGYVFSQSLVTALVTGGLYFIMISGIKYFSASKNGTNMFYEPTNISLPNMNSIKNFIKYITSFIKSTIGKLFNWFFYEVDPKDKKDITIKRRRMFLLTMICLVLLILVVI